MKTRGRKVYDPENHENKDRFGKTKPFKYKPDRATVRDAKRMMISESRKTLKESRKTNNDE